MRVWTLCLGAIIALIAAADPAFATIIGAPRDGQLGFQPAATPVKENIDQFHNLLLVIITGICVFVLGLLFWVMIRYNKRANKNPGDFSHNTLVEVIWTAVPVLILVIIAVPSFRLLYYTDRVPEEFDFTLKVTGYAWNWEYEYPDFEIDAFTASMVPDEALRPDQVRLLSTDAPVVVPVGSTVRVEVTAADVIHSWAMPSFGIKTDAIPGRLNQTWFEVGEEDLGIYFGQCAELCGRRHAFMPIEIHVVPQAVFDDWVAVAQDDPYEAVNVLTAYYDAGRETRLAQAR